MFNKSTLLFCVLAASGVVAVPVPHRKAASFVAAPIIAAAVTPEAAPACNKTLVTVNIAEMKQVAKSILAVGFVLPDPFRQNAKDSAKFDTVVTALNDADKGAAAGDFAAVSTKITFVSDAVSSLLEGKVGDGLESSIDLDLAKLVDETEPVAAACAASGGVDAASDVSTTPAAPVAIAAKTSVKAAPIATVAESTGACDTTALEDTIAQMKEVADDILSVGFVLPDPFRQNAKDAATFDTVVAAIDDADKAVAAGDFATALTKITFVSDKVESLLDGKVADGLESGIDLKLSKLTSDAETLVVACT